MKSTSARAARNGNLIAIIRLLFTSQFIKYGFIGVISLVADYGIFTGLYYGGHVSLKVAVPTGLVCGFVLNFTLNRIWAFEGARQESHYNVWVQFLLYIVLLGFNSVFSYYLIRTLQHFGLPALVGKAASTVITTLWNFVIYKKVIFRPRTVAETEAIESNAIY